MSLVVSLLVILLISTHVEALWNCPYNCSCSGADNTRLWIDCQQLSGHAEQLLTQLESLLSSNLTVGRLTALTIANSPLTDVPRSVCRLKTLTHLQFLNNRLTRLPDNCVSNLTELTSLKAIDNNITQLQDDLLNGLHRLRTVVFRNNQIVAVGPRAFTNSSSSYVDLSNNLLQDLDKRWIYEVGSNGNVDRTAEIKVQHNRISRFTNVDGLKLHCGMKRMHARLDVSYNEIRHLSDAVEAWQLTVRQMLCISPFVMGRSTVRFDISHNPFVCDCKDYWLYRIDASLHYFRIFEGARCSQPVSLRDLKIDEIRLDRFVCELRERCPLGCRCTYRPVNTTVHVDCSNTNLTVLPLELPQTVNNHSVYKLDFSMNSALRQLDKRQYFHRASIVDVSNCALTDITNWRELLHHVKSVYLHGNQLSSLPRQVTTLNVSTRQLSLHDNPWRCSCDDRWMADWLRVVSRRLSLQGVVSCDSPARLRGKNILQIRDEEFCVDPVHRAVTISVSSLVGVVVILWCVCVVVYRLRVKLYTRWKLRPFDRDECLGEDMDYDVFFCSSSQDHNPQGRRIVETIEANGYRVCYHYRDFMPGSRIFDNIQESVKRSKRTVCLLTTNFIHRLVCCF